MISYSIDNVSIEAPDAFQFAFGVIPLRCTWATNATSVKYIELNIETNGGTPYKQYYDQRTPVLRDGSYFCAFDLSAFARAAMSDDPQPFSIAGVVLTRSFIYRLTIYYVNGTSTMGSDYTFRAFWGSINTDEVFNDDIVAHYWRGYPSFVSAFFPSGTNTITRRVGASTSSRTMSGIGIRVISIDSSDGVADEITISSSQDAKFILSASYGVTTAPVSPRTKTIRVIKHIESNCDGVFLRWVDKQGFARFWVFKKGREQYQVSNSSSSLRNDIEFGAANGYNGTGILVEGKESTNKIQIGYPGATKDDIKILKSLLSSPYVEMRTYSGYARVTIATATTTFSQATLQDFTATIILPKEEIQSL